jgi:hypothetical protein
MKQLVNLKGLFTSSDSDCDIKDIALLNNTAGYEVFNIDTNNVLSLDTANPILGTFYLKASRPG